jgi:hypothetical protein
MHVFKAHHESRESHHTACTHHTVEDLENQKRGFQRNMTFELMSTQLKSKTAN